MAERDGDKAIVAPKKKKKAHAGGHGGAWKVAFADFMTSMFALFLVLWIISSTSAEAKEAIAQYFRHPTMFKAGSSSPLNMGGKAMIDKVQGEGMPEGPIASEKTVMKQLDSMMKADSALAALGKQFKTQMTDQGLRIELSDAEGLGYFEMGSSNLNTRMLDPLLRLAKVLTNASNKVVIAGHTDKYGYSAGGYSNWQLSADRANSVREYLASGGLDSSRFSGVIGYGDTQPANPENPYAPENRRVTLMVLKKDAQPGFFQ